MQKLLHLEYLNSINNGGIMYRCKNLFPHGKSSDLL